MDNQFNMNDMPKRIFTENSYFSQECSSLSSDNNSMNIAMESASSVIHKMNDNDSMSVLDEMKSMIKETEKTISKNILMEMYAFKTRHDGIGVTNEDHPFMTCKYTNLTSANIPNLDILITVLKEVFDRVSKFKNHYNPYDKDDFKDTLKDLMDMIRDRSENISGCVLGFNKHVDPHDFIVEMYLLYRSGNEYSVQEHAGSEYKSYEDEINECYLGIGNSVESYNSKLITCLSLFNDVMRLLEYNEHDRSFDGLNELRENLKKDVEVFTLRYLFIANIAYAGKADAVKDYLNPGNNDIKYGAHITNDEPLDLDLDFDLDDDDFTDDDDVEEMDFDLLEDDDVIVESAFDNIDIRNDYVPEYTQSPELYVLEAQIVSILNEELMAFGEAIADQAKAKTVVDKVKADGNNADDAEYTQPDQPMSAEEIKKKAAEQTTKEDQDKKNKEAAKEANKEEKKKDKKEKERGILEEIWRNIKKFFDKMLVRFSSAAGKYSADARSYVVDDIYKTYSKNDANQAPNLYPQFEGYYDKSVQRVKNIFDQIKNVSFTNKNIYDPNNNNTNYDASYFISKILPGSNYDGKTPLGEFCKTYFRGGDANTPIKLTNFGPNVPKDTFAAMIDLQLSAEITSSQLTKNISNLVNEADKFTQKYIRNFKQEAALPGLIKDHIASVLEEYFDNEEYKAFTEEDQPAGTAQPAEEPVKIQKIRTACKAYTDVLMNVMASACTTYEVLCNRNKRILKALQSGDPVKNSKENRTDENANKEQTKEQPKETPKDNGGENTETVDTTATEVNK